MKQITLKNLSKLLLPRHPWLRLPDGRAAQGTRHRPNNFNIPEIRIGLSHVECVWNIGVLLEHQGCEDFMGQKDRINTRIQGFLPEGGIVGAVIGFIPCWCREYRQYLKLTCDDGVKPDEVLPVCIHPLPPQEGGSNCSSIDWLVFQHLWP